MRNENEIVMHSTGRCGSHSIKNWIASMCSEPVYCFNNCPRHDPFMAKRRYWINIKVLPQLKKYFVPLPGFFPGNEAEVCRQKKKECLMYAYEMEDLLDLKNGEYIQDHDAIVGQSRNVYKVLVIRDVFNWLADNLMKRHYLINIKLAPLSSHPKYSQEPWVEDASKIPWRNHTVIGKCKALEMWKTFANEFIGKTNYLPGKICISFNRWFVDEDYRMEIAKALNLTYSDVTLHIAGSKSSFDETNRHKYDATNLPSLTDWRTVEHNKVFIELLDSVPGIRELSHEIFGKWGEQ